MQALVRVALRQAAVYAGQRDAQAQIGRAPNEAVARHSRMIVDDIERALGKRPRRLANLRALLVQRRAR